MTFTSWVLILVHTANVALFLSLSFTISQHRMMSAVSGSNWLDATKYMVPIKSFRISAGDGSSLGPIWNIVIGPSRRADLPIFSFCCFGESVICEPMKSD